MKVCLFSRSLKCGGAERIIAAIANHIAAKSGCEIHLILLGQNELFYNLSPNVIRHEPAFKLEETNKVTYALKTATYIRRTVKSIRPDTILSFGEIWNSFVLLSLWGLPYPIFVSDRSNPSHKFGILQTYLRRILYRKAKGIIAQTEIAKDILSKSIRHKNIKVIGNPVREIKNNGVAKENIILNVGRFIPSKHQKTLIDLFSQLDTRDWKLVFLGDGECLNECKNRVSELEIEDKVFFEGNISDVDSYYNRSKIFAFTSSSEGFPNVLAEALATPLATISFYFQAGCEELLQDNENGFVIPPGNNDLYVKKLQQLIDDDELRARFEANSHKIRKKFENKGICEIFYTFIGEI